MGWANHCRQPYSKLAMALDLDPVSRYKPLDSAERTFGNHSNPPVAPWKRSQMLNNVIRVLTVGFGQKVFVLAF
jgi:hypothetical protein